MRRVGKGAKRRAPLHAKVMRKARRWARFALPTLRTLERKHMLRAILSVTALAFSVGAAGAQEPLKIGLIQSMTGAFNTVGKAAVNGARLYIQQHGDTVAGRKIQLIVKDDATSPETAKRLAQELIVNDKVAIIGAGITPSALS